MRLYRYTQLLIVAGFITMLAGCSTIGMVVEHHDLETHTKASSSIFLNPVPLSKRTIFVQVHNTTDKGNFGLGHALKKQIRAEGWNVVRNPNKATIILQANVLKEGKIEPNRLRAILNQGYGGVVASAAAAAAIAGAAGSDLQGAGIASVAAGAADWVGGLMFDNVSLAVVTDVRIKQRLPHGQTRMVRHRRHMASGYSGSASARYRAYRSRSPFKVCRTRIVSTANQVNLTWKEAAPRIRNDLATVMSGVF